MPPRIIGGDTPPACIKMGELVVYSHHRIAGHRGRACHRVIIHPHRPWLFLTYLQLLLKYLDDAFGGVGHVRANKHGQPQYAEPVRTIQHNEK